MNSMFSVWACEDIAHFKNKPKVILHIPSDETRDNVPVLSIKRAHLVLNRADDILIRKGRYDGLTDDMLLITYMGEHDKSSRFPPNVTVDIKELVDNIYATGFSPSVYPF